MMIPLCRHIFPGGTLCQGAAVHDTYFCRHHQFVKTTLADASQPVAYGAPPQLPFVFAEDRASIQLNLMMVLKALNDGKIDTRTANSMTRILNSCMRNLKAGLLVDPQAKDVARTVITTPDGDEIAPPREAPEQSVRDAGQRSQKDADSVDAEDRPLDPDSPYADLWHLPSPEFAYRVFERATQIHEAKRAAQRTDPDTAQPDCAARIEATIDAGFESPVDAEFTAGPDLGALSQKRASSAIPPSDRSCTLNLLRRGIRCETDPPFASAAALHVYFCPTICRVLANRAR